MECGLGGCVVKLRERGSGVGSGVGDEDTVVRMEVLGVMGWEVTVQGEEFND